MKNSSSLRILTLSDEYPSSIKPSFVNGGAGVHLQMMAQVLSQNYFITVFAKNMNTDTVKVSVERKHPKLEVHWIPEKYFQKSIFSLLIGTIIIRICSLCYLPQLQSILLWNLSISTYLYHHPEFHFDLILALEFRANALFLQLLSRIRSLIIIVGWSKLHLEHNNVQRLTLDDRLIDILEKLTTFLAKEVTTTSHLLQEKIHRWISRKPLPSLPFFFSQTNSKNRTIPQKFTSARPAQVYYIGRLEPRKGVDFLLKIARDKQLPPTIFRFWGKDELGRFTEFSSEYSRFHDLVEKHRTTFSHQVEVLPSLPMEDLKTTLLEADIVVLPSRFDPLNLVALEALSLNKCVVLTSAMGAAEAIVSGKTGYIALPTRQSLHSVLSLLLYHPHRIQKVQHNLRQHNPLAHSEREFLHFSQTIVENMV